MGLRSALGLKSPKRPKQPASDKALAKISRGQSDRFFERFAPLTDMLDVESQIDRSATLRGRGAADVIQSLGAPRAPGSTGQVGSSVQRGTRALGTAMTGASQQAAERQRGLTKGVMDVATGQGHSGIAGLGQAAQMSTNRAIRKLQHDEFKANLLADTIGSAVGMAAGAAGGGPMPAGGTQTKLGTFDRNVYNTRVGKGGF